MKENKKTVTPDMTVNVKNPELLQAVRSYKEDRTTENLNLLLNRITACRILIPANRNNKKQPVPCFIKNKDGKTFLPVYTDKEQMAKAPKTAAIMNMPFPAANKMALSVNPKLGGIVINPFTENLIFLPPLLEKIEEIETLKKEGKLPKAVNMTQQQYTLFERVRYETGFLPKKLFAEGGAFIDRLCEEKEEYLDQLYEESYQQKRMYPYLPEDFSVMAMDISDDLLIVRADMPARDMGPGAAFRIYLTWNKKTEKGGFFRIARGKEQAQTVLDEVTAEQKLVSHGEAPVEGAELQTILELASGDVGLTS